MPALAFTRLHEHLKKSQPKKADERIEAAVRRALANNWSFKRCDEFVASALAGRPDKQTGEMPAGAPGPVFSLSANRFVVDLVRLKSATNEQLAALKAALTAMLATARPPAAPVGQR